MANLVSRYLVAAPHRDGGQTQFIDAPVPTPQETVNAHNRIFAKLILFPSTVSPFLSRYPDIAL